MTAEKTRPFDFDKMQIGEELGSFEYVLTQKQLDDYRESIDEPDAMYPTIAIKHDATALSMVYDAGPGGANARNEIHFHNPPIPGKKIKVTARIVDKYVRRDAPYLVIEATAVDEDGRLIEDIKTYQLKRPSKVGEKWSNR